MPNATGRDYHIDTLLTNLSVGYRPTGFVGPDLFPVVPVAKQSNVYAKVDREGWFRLNDTNRAPKTKAKEGSFSVSSDTYFATNYAFATAVAYEDIDNADAPHVPLQRGSEFLIDQLMLDAENRVMTRATAGVGSTTTLTGINAWSDFGNSDPLGDFDIAKEAIRRTTGKRPNTCVLGPKVWLKLQRHPDLVRAAFPGAGVGGMVNAQQLATILGVDRVLVGEAIKNVQPETSPESSSFTDVWSSYCLLAHVAPSPGLMVPTFGYAFRWAGPNIGGGGPPSFSVERKRDDDIKAEMVRAGYYQDEKIVASELGFLIVTGIS